MILDKIFKTCYLMDVEVGFCAKVKMGGANIKNSPVSPHKKFTCKVSRAFSRHKNKPQLETKT